MVTLAQSAYSVTKGSTLTLKCSVAATPAVTSVVWKRTINGVESYVITDGATYSGSTPNNPSLTIIGVNRTDAGTYVCSATNIVGTVESGQTVLSVTGGKCVT